MRVLKVDFFRAGAVCQLIQYDFNNLDVHVVNPRDTSLIQVNMGCRCSLHGFAPSLRGFYCLTCYRLFQLA
jgi:hypothetical protein